MQEKEEILLKACICHIGERIVNISARPPIALEPSFSVFVQIRRSFLCWCPQVFHQPVSGNPRWITGLSGRSNRVPTLSSGADPHPGPSLHSENELRWWVVKSHTFQYA